MAGNGAEFKNEFIPDLHLDKGEKILLVGIHAREFPDHFWKDSRIEFWYAGDPNIRTKAKLPEGTRAVIFNRSVHPALVEQVKKLASKNVRFIYMPVVGTGRIRTGLRELLDYSKKEKPPRPRQEGKRS